MNFHCNVGIESFQPLLDSWGPITYDGKLKLLIFSGCFSAKKALCQKGTLSLVAAKLKGPNCTKCIYS